MMLQSWSDHVELMSHHHIHLGNRMSQHSWPGTADVVSSWNQSGVMVESTEVAEPKHWVQATAVGLQIADAHSCGS